MHVNSICHHSLRCRSPIMGSICYTKEPRSRRFIDSSGHGKSLSKTWIIFITWLKIPILGLEICFSGGEFLALVRCYPNLRVRHLATRSWGFQTHIWDLTPKLAVSSRKVILAVMPLHLAATMLIRVSILLFYRRLSNEAVSPRFARLIRVVISIVIIYTAVFMLLAFFICRPINAYWSLVDPEWAKMHIRGVDYTCLDEPTYLIAVAICSIIMDFTTWIIPLPLFWKLALPFRQKITLTSLFAVALL
jgi:hypothetical protein